MRICLLLLFLVSSSFAQEVEVSYKLIPNKGAIYRRADVVVSCNFPVEGSRKINNYTLEVSRSGQGVNVTVSFRGKGIHLYQPLKKGQSLDSAMLSKVNILTGETVENQPIKFRNGKIYVNSLDDRFVYRLSYTVLDGSAVKRLIPPQVELIGSSEAEEKKEHKVLKIKIPVFFSSGSYSLSEKEKLVLNELKNFLKSGYCSVKVIGYADGTAIVKSKVSSNEILAKLRAMAVKNYLER